MLKRLSVLFALFFILVQAAFAGSAEEKRLLGMVPGTAETVISITGSEWTKVPSVSKRVFESRNITVFTRKAKLSLSDLKAAVFWSTGGKNVILTLWETPFEPEKVFAAPHFRCTKEQKNGNTIYHVESKLPAGAKKKVPAKVKKFCVIQLPGAVTGFFTNPEFALEFARKPQVAGESAFAFPSTLTGTLRGVTKDKRLPVGRIFFSCSMTGKDKQDFSGEVRVECGTAEEAELFRSQATLASSLGLMQFLKYDPQLANDIQQCLNFSTTGKALVANILLPEAILTRLNGYAAKAEKIRQERMKKKRAKSSGGTPAK